MNIDEAGRDNKTGYIQLPASAAPHFADSGNQPVTHRDIGHARGPSPAIHDSATTQDKVELGHAKQTSKLDVCYPGSSAPRREPGLKVTGIEFQPLKNPMLT
jgi:hypothetical protein